MGFYIRCRVSSKKEKSFREHFFLNHFASFSHCSPAKNAKISRKNNTKKIERNQILFIKHLYYVKEEKLFQILSYQSREFDKFVWAINCCSYKTNGFHKTFAFGKNIFTFIIFAKIFSHFSFSRNFRISHFHLIYFRE